MSMDNRVIETGTTHTIIGCAMAVHRTLGSGFQEVIYQRALEIELGHQGLPFRREIELPIYYRGQEIGTRRVDFLVEGSETNVMVELKAVVRLEDVHLAQAINYLEAYQLSVGLLINFGARSLEFKRVLKPLNQAASTQQPNKTPTDRSTQKS